MQGTGYALGRRLQRWVNGQGPAQPHAGRGAGEDGRGAGPLGPSLQRNLERLRQALGDPPDLDVRELALGTRGQVRVAVVALSGMSDAAAINLNILKSATLEASASLFDQAPAAVCALLRELVLTVTTVQPVDTLPGVADRILGGSAVVLVDGHPVALACGTPGFKTREIGEPATEGVVRGPREAFTENLDSNIAMLRRRLRSPRMRLQQLRIGAVSQTEVVIAYVDGIARPEILREVRARLQGIRVDAILESGYLEEYLEDYPASFFPQIEHTERPDKAAAALMEGRVAILTNNTPFALLVPTLFVHFMQSAEDYYERYMFASALRAIRTLGFFCALLLPSIYVALTTIHQEMIPMGLALQIAGSREGNPFPAFVEALAMEVVFELLREAGVRLPRPVGPAVSIVGGLVVGEAAVRAGVASPVMVVIVAITGIANFAIPAFNLAVTLRLLRFPMIMVAALAGLPGVTLAVMAIIAHMAALRSFGIPYLAPVAPARYRQWTDVLVRAPWWAMNRRPRPLAADRQRQERGQKPVPPHQDDPRGGR